MRETTAATDAPQTANQIKARIDELRQQISRGGDTTSQIEWRNEIIALQDKLITLAEIRVDELLISTMHLRPYFRPFTEKLLRDFDGRGSVLTCR